jgi:hypothetical protein
MSRLLIVLLVILVIAFILYRRNEQIKAVERDRNEALRSLPGPTSARVRPIATASGSSETADGGGRFQDAADTALGVGLNKTADQMEEMTAGLAAARHEADLAAASLARRADEALASVQAAAAAHGGAVPGDGSANCPATFPIKGELTAMLFHESGHRTYASTLPDVCFSSIAAAEAAGFSAVDIQNADLEIDLAVPAASIGAEAGAVQARGNGMQPDVVAEAIEAADAGGVPPGAIRGDGGRDCPSAYPIKGNRSSGLFHEPGTATYQSTIPEFCFASAESAQAAGFSATRY